MAFLHHLAAFTVVGALVAEVVLFKPPLTVAQARRLQRIDSIFGISAGVLLAVGLLRVIYFEKGAGYYFADAFFLAKFVAFLWQPPFRSIPRCCFCRGAKRLKQGVVPEMSATQVRRTRMCLMLEMTAIVVILFCAPFMARGFGYFGG